jgi:hypothetical protein
MCYKGHMIPYLYPVSSLAFLFTVFFFPWPWVLFLSGKTARIPADVSQLETLLPAERRKCCSFPLIDKRCRALLSSCKKQIPASAEVGILKTLISALEFALQVSEGMIWWTEMVFGQDVVRSTVNCVHSKLEVDY